MVERCSKKITYFFPYIFALTLILTVVGGAILSILLRTHEIPFIEIMSDEHIKYILLFTVWQALLSTFMTIITAIPIARALHRRYKFFGRSFLIKITTLSFIIPSIVLVLGVATVHGKNGIVNKVFGIFDYSLDYYLYGMFGILIAHMAFNLPIAIRVFLNRLEQIPPNNWRLANQLAFTSRNIFTNIELPILLPPIVGVSVMVFLLCFTSFVVVLSLGGEPNYATLEVAIYQALKFDLDINKAVLLSTFQLFVSSILMILIIKLSNNAVFVCDIENHDFERPDAKNRMEKIIDFISICLLIFIIVLPLASIVVSGINERFFYLIYSKELWDSFLQTAKIATSSGLLSVVLSGFILSGSFYMHYHCKQPKMAVKIAMIANASIIVSPFIFATGFFLLLHNVIDIYNNSIWFLILINSLISLPFVTGILYNPVTSFSKEEIYLSQNLNIKGINFLKYVIWGKIRRAISYALGLAVAMSWGDLSVIALFGTKDFMTLPYLLYKNISNYQVNDAVVIAFIILIVSFSIIWFIEEFIGGEKSR